MKSIYVKDLFKGQFVEFEPFAVFEVQRGEDKNKNPYLNLLIGDKTGKVPAKVWAETIAKIQKGVLKTDAVVRFSGRVDEFKGNLQLTVMEVKPVDEHKLDDFIAASKYDPQKLITEVEDAIAQIKNQTLQKVLWDFFGDKEFKRKFMFWPAGNTVHHDFQSGLLQHVVEMLKISESLRYFYPDLNYDVLIAGVILHDSGKTEELSGGLSSQYTKIGGLLGHISIGSQMFTERAKKHNLDEDTMLHVNHLILSHHGMLEFGSPILPSTPEAIALYHIDGVSSKTRAALKAVDEISSDNDFGKPNYWLEGARFWKNHNKEVQDNYENDDSQDQMSLGE